ncbi:uncharacterized protein J4E88_001700 [Alternaria novae-zelandiae]|uniref:uncharacterized protein n=1 Tax=Alternaria novae-zelandiae TaxID=430562 RepID=UPI0020C2BA72|nr:uncharacterized protein J4E88_001700 [Alternaria novae-zelandiae]KAI4693329.1 hypothetical protein J4E88_001700 [Alternaria novae-zelandiae]
MTRPPNLLRALPPAAQPEQDAAYDMIYAANQPTDLAERVSSLSPAWQINAARKSITRTFTFTSFAKAWRFMSLVADECKVKKHHPSWSNLYNRVEIEWTTHKPEGLSIKDVDMAEFCDRKAAEIGLKEPE